MKVLYTEHSMSEYDYVMNDVLHGIEKEIELFHKGNFLDLLNRTDIIGNNIFVINDGCTLHNIIMVVEHLKPCVILYLSDETGTHADASMLQSYTPLFFRQYNHSHYPYGPNNHQIPLGYLKYYLNGKNSREIVPKNIESRSINCSFIGTPKSDRGHMMAVFTTQMANTHINPVINNWNFENLPVPQKVCFDTYSDSIFVICGRGNCSLDCFRIYEAIVAGAIPVIVGGQDEINRTFYYNNRLPPLLYFSSWEEAVLQCNKLLLEPEVLQKKQDDLLAWWHGQMASIHSLIQTSIRR